MHDAISSAASASPLRPNETLETEAGFGVLKYTAPKVTLEMAADILQRAYGFEAELSRLGGERDANFLVRTRKDKLVAKISSADFPSEAVEREDEIIRHAVGNGFGPQLPTTLANGRSEKLPLVTTFGDQTFRVRLMPFIAGKQLSDLARSEWPVARLGAMVGEFGKALEGAPDPVFDDTLLWNAACLDRLAPLANIAREDDLTSNLSEACSHFSDKVKPRLAAIPHQCLHNDLNPHNIMVTNHRPRSVCGVFDFGDAIKGPRIQEFATFASYLMDAPDPFEDLILAFKTFCAACHVSPAEAELAPHLIVARLATTLLITNWRAQQVPEEREYILRNASSAYRGFTWLDADNLARLCEAMTDTASSASVAQ